MPVEKTKTTSFLLLFFRCIPQKVRKGLFLLLFILFYHLVPRNRLIALHNLRCSFPEKEMNELIRITKGVYRNFAIVAAEFFDLPYINKENIHEWLEVKGLENFQKAYAKSKGVLSIVAHFGNWELMAIAGSIFLKPMHIVYRPLDNPTFNNIVEYVRTVQGNSLVPKEKAALRIIRLLRDNQLIAILNDQNVAREEGVFVDFFGRPACTGIGLAAMAISSGAPVLPCFMARQKSGKYLLILQPAVEAVCTGDYERDLLVNTQRFTKIVEEVIREYPEQWFWVHQRWKTKPWQA
ncbi:MAG: lysophospholipid acyltransferase family protein [Smithella sp.]